MSSPFRDWNCQLFDSPRLCRAETHQPAALVLEGKSATGTVKGGGEHPKSREAEAASRKRATHDRGVLCLGFFLASPCMQDLSSLSRARTRVPLQWKHRALTTGPPGNSWGGCSLKSILHTPSSLSLLAVPQLWMDSRMTHQCTMNKDPELLGT